ncbi:MAG TPA: hypothetical protein VKT29_07730 [Terriglobales bacterium]|nr:hypothetical protein [Terriglobales bacterium]
MRKKLMTLLAMMFLLSPLALFAQPRQGGMGQEPAQTDSAKPAKKAKKEKKAKTKKAKKEKKADKKSDEMQH